MYRKSKISKHNSSETVRNDNFRTDQYIGGKRHCQSNTKTEEELYVKTNMNYINKIYNTSIYTCILLFYLSHGTKREAKLAAIKLGNTIGMMACFSPRTVGVGT